MLYNTVQYGTLLTANSSLQRVSTYANSTVLYNTMQHICLLSSWRTGSMAFFRAKWFIKGDKYVCLQYPCPALIAISVMNTKKHKVFHRHSVCLFSWVCLCVCVVFGCCFFGVCVCMCVCTHVRACVIIFQQFGTDLHFRYNIL